MIFFNNIFPETRFVVALNLTSFRVNSSCNKNFNLAFKSIKGNNYKKRITSKLQKKYNFLFYALSLCAK